MLVRDFIKIMHRLAPPDLAADWDNSGLQVGSPGKEIRRIGLSLDATVETVASALAAGCDLLLAHHPLIFRPLKNFITDHGPGAVAKAALAGDLAIFSAHTNWDNAALGVASALAELLELEHCRPLEAAARNFYKLVVFVPAGYENRIRQALFEAGVGQIGDYDRCWFAAPGEGGFRIPSDGRPFLGRPGQEARARESRLELILPLALAETAAQAIREQHPYQEPAFEFQAVKTYGPDQGLGLVGEWNPPRELLAEIGRHSEFPAWKWAGPKPGPVHRLALLPGSGGNFGRLARRQGAQALITGDLSYHQALEAADLGLTLVDLGHYETEWPGVTRLARLLTEEMARVEPRIECLVLEQSPPWYYQAGTK